MIKKTDWILRRLNWPAKKEAIPVTITNPDNEGQVIIVFLDEDFNLCVEIGSEFQLNYTPEGRILIKLTGEMSEK